MKFTRWFEFKGKYDNEKVVNGSGYIGFNFENMEISVECHKALDIQLLFKLIYEFLVDIKYTSLNTMPFEIETGRLVFSKKSHGYGNFNIYATRFKKCVGEIYVSSMGRINQGMEGDLCTILNLLHEFGFAKAPTGDIKLKFTEAKQSYCIDALISFYQETETINLHTLKKIKHHFGWCEDGWSKFVEELNTLPQDHQLRMDELKKISYDLGYEKQYAQVERWLALNPLSE